MYCWKCLIVTYSKLFSILLFRFHSVDDFLLLLVFICSLSSDHCDMTSEEKAEMKVGCIASVILLQFLSAEFMLSLTSLAFRLSYSAAKTGLFSSHYYIVIVWMGFIFRNIKFGSTLQSYNSVSCKVFLFVSSSLHSLLRWQTVERRKKLFAT